MRVGLRLVDREANPPEVIGFVDFDLRGKELREYQADPDKWSRETHDVLVEYMKALHKKRGAATQ